MDSVLMKDNCYSQRFNLEQHKCTTVHQASFVMKHLLLHNTTITDHSAFLLNKYFCDGFQIKQHK